MSIELFFDTETTGLPSWKASHTDPKQPDIIQLAAVLMSEGEVLKELSTIINPSAYCSNWEMNPFAEKAHGISKERVIEEGKCGKEIFPEFMALVEQADLLVCHNVNFDRMLLLTGLYRAGYIEEVDKLKAAETYCTMYKSTSMCGLRNSKGGAKWPKLMELHNFLFECDFEDAHDALNDVRATARCYYAMRERGL